MCQRLGAPPIPGVANFHRSRILNVLFVTSEIVPLIKTGGLADVSGSLPPALARLGLDVRVLLPAYPAVVQALQSSTPWRVLARLPASAGLPAARLLEATGPDSLPLILLDCPLLFDRPGNPYLGPDGQDWPDNHLRFGLLSRVAAMLSQSDSPLSWKPDVLHLNDWQSAPAAVYLAHQSGPRAATVVTIHNLAYQGLFARSVLEPLGLPATSYHLDGLEFHDRVSFLKGGLAFADAITTVSPRYAAEICTEALGFGLDGLLRKRQSVLWGILNGIDTAIWNPASDPCLAHPFDATRLDQRALNKGALQRQMGLPDAPGILLLGMITRLVTQKGVDMVADLVDRITGLPAQLVILGSGDKALESRLRQLARQHSRQVSVRIGYDETLSHAIEAGCDAFLMPSRFEPCGMNQMYSQRYGCLPIVCQTGGLADSVLDAGVHGLDQGEATGFMVPSATTEALWQTICQAHTVYGNTKIWQQMQRAAMRRDFSWDRSAQRYRDLYQRLCAE
jgi:starch synthase